MGRGGLLGFPFGRKAQVEEEGMLKARSRGRCVHFGWRAPGGDAVKVRLTLGCKKQSSM